MSGVATTNDQIHTKHHEALRISGKASSINVRKVLWTCDEIGILRESDTICRYLAAQHDRADPLPKTAKDRARVEQWMDWQATELNGSWRYAFQPPLRSASCAETIFPRTKKRPAATTNILGNATPDCYQKRMSYPAQPAVSNGGIQIAFRLLRLTVVLLRRFWPQLAAIWLLGFIGNLLLNEMAAMIGRLNSLAGLSVLAIVVLLKLIIIVALFETVRGGLPALDAASRSPAEKPEEQIQATEPGNFVGALALGLVPFFAFYAAWGFLGDTVRDYSRLSLSLFLSGEGAGLLDVSGGAWLAVPVLIAWAVRRCAKAMHKRSRASIWPVLIVICEANWAFIGLFVVSEWQEEIRAWFSHLPETIGMLLGFLAPAANAIAQQTTPPPPEFSAPPLSTQIVSLFFYALYPVVWLTLAALVYGYDIHGERAFTGARLARAASRWEALPKSVRDFISHFISGTLKRYRALAEGIGLALNSGIVAVVVAIVVYRLLDWGSAWAWYGLTQVIGPHDLPFWQIIAQIISPFIGPPSEPGEGLLVTPIKICLLAATLEIGFTQGREWRGRQPLAPKA